MMNTMYEQRQEESKAQGRRQSEIKYNDQRFIQVAVGGTGKTSLLQMENDEELKSVINLYIDTDPSELSRIPSERKFLMNDFAAARYFSELEHHPERFPHMLLVPYVKQFQQALGRAKDISTGLRTARILGRPLLDLYAVRSFPKLAAFFLQPARILHAYSSNPCADDFQGHSQERFRLTVTFVHSICGGTGSSVGQLLQHLSDYLLIHQGGFTRYNLDADLFLPGVLESKANAPDMLRANAYAFLIDNLNAIQQELPNYHLGHVSLKHNLPLRHIYLFDNVNAVGEVLESKEQVTQMRNATWKLRSLGRSGEEHRSRVTDIHLDVPAFYSAAGAAILEHDVEHTIRVLAHHTALDVIDGKLQTLPDDETQVRILQQWNNWGKTCGQLRSLPSLESKLGGGSLEIDFASVNQQARSRVNRIMHHTIRRGYGEWQQAFEKLIRHEVEVRQQLLVAQLGKALNRPDGFSVAGGLIEQLRQYWEREAQILEKAIMDDSLHINQEREHIKEVPTTLWRRWQWNPRGSYIRRYQTYMNQQLKLVRHQAQAQIAKEFLALLSKVSEQIAMLRSTLQTLRSRLETEQAAYLGLYRINTSVAVHSVVCQQDIDTWYKEHALQACDHISQQIHIVWFDDTNTYGLERRIDGTVDTRRLPILSQEGIDRHLEHSQMSWQHVREYSVESLLRQRGVTPIEVYTELERLSTPWVSLDDVKAIPPERHLQIVTTRTIGFFHDLPEYPGLSIVATGNPYQITMLSTWHGIDPLVHLTQSQDQKRSYIQAVAAGRNLHLFPELSQEEPLFEDSYSTQASDLNNIDDVSSIKEVSGESS